MINGTERQMSGIMGNAMKMPDPGVSLGNAPNQAAPVAANAGQSTSDPADMIERVLTAAVRILKTPQGKQELMAAAQAPDPREAVSRIAYDLMVGIDEKTGSSIEEPVLQQAAQQVVQMLIGLLSPQGEGQHEPGENEATEAESPAQETKE